MTTAVLRRQSLHSSYSGPFLSLLQRGRQINRCVKCFSTSEALVPTDTARKNGEERVQRKITEESYLIGDNQPNKFIPVTRLMLVNTLLEDRKLLSPEERERIRDLSASLDTCILQQFYTQLDELKLLYDDLDPDKDTITTKMSAKDRLDSEYWLLHKLEHLLYKANYLKIPKEKVLLLLQEHNTSEGVRVAVDPSRYSVLKIWTRGFKKIPLPFIEKLKFGFSKVLSRGRDERRGPMNEVFTRVFIAVRSKKESKLHLKVFKDVPCPHLEYLLPDGKIRMSMFDKGFLTSSVFLGSIVAAAKGIALAGDYNMDFAWIGLGLAGLIGARGWLGYKNKRNAYLVNLSRTLYFKSVSNNRGVLTLLTDRAQDEEFKESLLAYVFLLSPPNRRGVPGLAYTARDPAYDTEESLKERIEDWLKNKFKITGVSFDVEDALLKLDTMGLLVRHADETLSVVPMSVALETLPRPSLILSGGLRNSETIEEGDGRGEDPFSYHEGWR